jgi:hypothetical protein
MIVGLNRVGTKVIKEIEEKGDKNVEREGWRRTHKGEERRRLIRKDGYSSGSKREQSKRREGALR